MSWLTEDWRLKLLALGLAVLMLGAVAASQNPPTSNTLAIPLHYTQVGADQNLVIINPPSKVNVTFTGLADVIHNATPDNFSATVDATRATTGPAVKLNVVVTATNGVTIQSPAPIVVRVDTLQAVDLPVVVVARGSPGWVVTKTVSNPVSVHFVGPQSWTNHLTASVIVGTPIAGNQVSLLNQPIQLQNSNGGLQLTPCTTQPCASLDNLSAAITVNAQTGTTSTTVPLIENPLPPSAQFQLIGVSVNPVTVTITGDPAVLAKIQRIILPAVDLSGATATVTSQVNIPYPDGVTPLNGTVTAKITFTIQRNPSVSPSP